jgi:hypothetical protein
MLLKVTMKAIINALIMELKVKQLVYNLVYDAHYCSMQTSIAVNQVLLTWPIKKFFNLLCDGAVTETLDNSSTSNFYTK